MGLETKIYCEQILIPGGFVFGKGCVKVFSDRANE